MWRERSADNSEVDMATDLATDLGIHPRARNKNDKDASRNDSTLYTELTLEILQHTKKMRKIQTKFTR